MCVSLYCVYCMCVTVYCVYCMFVTVYCVYCMFVTVYCMNLCALGLKLGPEHRFATSHLPREPVDLWCVLHAPNLTSSSSSSCIWHLTRIQAFRNPILFLPSIAFKLSSIPFLLFQSPLFDFFAPQKLSSCSRRELLAELKIICQVIYLHNEMSV